MRQVVLDTETTGLETAQGHRVIEIGCIELISRRATGRQFHHYLNPDREIDEAAQQVHGISNERLVDMPRFPEIADELLEFISGAELVIHNAEFDVGFLNNEFKLAGYDAATIEIRCQVTDTLPLARRMHPGQRNSLDALCKRYDIDNSRRELHGALLDAQLLADVYLVMTGGQETLSLESGDSPEDRQEVETAGIDRRGLKLVVQQASAAELKAHDRQLDLIDAACENGVLWRRSKPC